MKSVLDGGFEEDAQFDLEQLHEKILHQFHEYRQMKREGIPLWADSRQERLLYINKWSYIHDRFATWLSQTDQETMVGSKLNTKFEEIKEKGQKDDWNTTPNQDNHSHTNKPPETTTANRQQKIADF